MDDTSRDMMEDTSSDMTNDTSRDLMEYTSRDLMHSSSSDWTDDTPRDLINFCLQLVHYSQHKLKRIFLCGSLVDNFLIQFMARTFNVDSDLLDFDRMQYHTHQYAVNRSVACPTTSNLGILRIYTDDTHAGYVRLIREIDNTELLIEDLHRLADDETMHGPAVISYNTVKDMTEIHSLSRDAIDTAMHRSATVGSYDDVYAVHSPYWPDEAAEWVSRRRSNGFPSKSVIKQVVRYGCDFVQVSHNRLYNDGEWRFSFSRAEQFIGNSWSMSQRIVYGTLWVLNKTIASSNLCTYYFKTLMFWACEEKPFEFWREDSLMDSVCELLITMMTWIKLKYCVNYFIPANNMMDHLIDADLNFELDALWRLWKTSKSHQFIAEALNMCCKWEHVLDRTRMIYRIEMTAWRKRAYLICHRIENYFDNYEDLFRSDLTADLQSALYAELSDIYRGLYFQQKSANGLNECDKRIHSLKSECYLILAVNLCDSHERDAMETFSDQLVWSMVGGYVSDKHDLFDGEINDNEKLNTDPGATTDTQNSLNGDRAQKCVLYCRSENNAINDGGRKNNNEKNAMNVTVYNSIELNSDPDPCHYKSFTDPDPCHYKSFIDPDACHYKSITDPDACHYESFTDWPGRSPTVNVSWFIAKAYLANLYYTTQRDVSLTIKTCDDVIDAYQQASMNELFAERVFSVVISTLWTSIYDQELQELLGFYSLSSYALSPERRSVYLGVCPVQFALYLKLRTEGAHGFSDDTVNTYLTDYFSHIDKCRCDCNVRNGAGFVTKSMHHYLIQYTRNVLLK